MGGGVALYGAYAADVNLDSSALKDAAVVVVSLTLYLPGYLPGVATPGADIQWTSS